MNPKAAEKSLNSNTRCRFPFTTLQPLSLRNSTAISCSESFVTAMSDLLFFVHKGIIRRGMQAGQACVAQALLPVRFSRPFAFEALPAVPKPAQEECLYY